MKKLLDKLKINKSLFIFLLIILAIALISGSLLMTILNDSDKTMITKYLEEFLNNTFNNKLNYTSSYKSALIINFIFIITMWVLGISVVGFLIIIFMYFIKVFIIGFSVGALITNYKIKGVLLSFIYVFPHHILNILIYILLTAYSLIMSFKILSCFNKKTVSLRPFIKKYTYVLIISLIVILLTTSYEIFLMPKIIHLIEPIIK